jgi:hypothetical protein
MQMLLEFLSAFRQGKMVANPALWKNGQITVSVLAGFIVTLLQIASHYNIDIYLTDMQINNLSLAIVSFVGVFISPVVTVVSSEKVGLPPKSATDNAAKTLGGGN